MKSVKTPATEFAFFREKLEKIGTLLVQGSSEDIKEVCFHIGSLHTICCYNEELFEDKKDGN